MLESKKTTLSVLSAFSALPQAFVYIMASPKTNIPVFGMVTNGDDILFVKLVNTQDTSYCGVSCVFTPFTNIRELYSILQILRRFGQIVI
ncbi:MAG: hypothetical protein HRU34_05450 [Richelia sp.]|nr:hypothetical protein [Richelia sp.]